MLEFDQQRAGCRDIAATEGGRHPQQGVVGGAEIGADSQHGQKRLAHLRQHVPYVGRWPHLAARFDEAISSHPVRRQSGRPDVVVGCRDKLIQTDLDFAQQGDQPVAWLIGGLIGARWPFATALPLLTTLSFALAGALVALNARVRDVGVVAFVIMAGVLHGLVNGATMVPAEAGALALAGAISAIFFLTAILSAEVTALPAGWPRIVVRVAGSWIAATGLLMLGWLARSQHIYLL